MIAIYMHTPLPQELCCHVRKKAAAEASGRNRKWVCVTHTRRGSADCEQQPLCMNVLAAVQRLLFLFSKTQEQKSWWMVQQCHIQLFFQ